MKSNIETITHTLTWHREVKLKRGIIHYDGLRIRVIDRMHISEYPYACLITTENSTEYSVPKHCLVGCYAPYVDEMEQYEKDRIINAIISEFPAYQAVKAAQVDMVLDEQGNILNYYELYTSPFISMEIIQAFDGSEHSKERAIERGCVYIEGEKHEEG